MNKLLIFFGLLLFITVSLIAQEADDPRGKADEDDFVVVAASGGMMEVELGKLAEKRAESKDVKDFAQRMVRDHSKANDELKNIAQQNNIKLPDSLLEKHKEHVDELSELSGAEFDEAYMDLMVSDHEEDIELFEEASENYKNEEVKKWAEKTLPVLKEHHNQAKTIKDKTEN